MAIEFDSDAVSVNVRSLLAKGIGRTEDFPGRISAVGTPEFNNDDIRRHQALIGQASPGVLGQSPNQGALAITGANFRSLDDTTFNNIQDVQTRIAELQAQKFENDAKLAAELTRDPVVSGAQSILGSLQMERALTTTPAKFAKLDQQIQRAQVAMDNAMKIAGVRVEGELNRRNNLLNADITRLQGRMANLTALDKKASEGQSRGSKLVVPIGMAEIIKGGVPELETDADVNNWVKGATKETLEMWRNAFQDGANHMPLWDPKITAGNRQSYETWLVSKAPEEEKAGVIAQINITKERMKAMRELAIKEFDLKLKDDSDEAKAFKTQVIQDVDFLPRQIEVRFQQLMLEGNAGDFDTQVVGGMIDFVDPKGFSTDLFEAAQELQAKIPQDAQTAQEGILKALQNMDLSFEDKQRLASQFIGQQAFRFNQRARFTGSNVPGTLIRNSQNNIILALNNQAMIDAQKELIKGNEQANRMILSRSGALGRALSTAPSAEDAQLVRDAARGALDSEIDTVITKLEQVGAGGLTDWEVVLARRATGELLRAIPQDNAMRAGRSGMIPQAPLGLENNPEFDPQFRGPPGATPPGGVGATPQQLGSAIDRALSSTARAGQRLGQRLGLSERNRRGRGTTGTRG